MDEGIVFIEENIIVVAEAIRKAREEKLDRYENLISIEKMDKDRYKLIESSKGKGLRITLFDSNGKIEKELKYK